MIELTRFRRTCRDLWQIAKQVWYVPFIWAFAWFSFWIFRDVIVLKHTLTQGNPSSYVGAAISITALLVAGIVAANSRKKRLLEKASPAEINPIKTHVFREARDDGSRAKNAMVEGKQQPKPFMRRRSSIETDQVQNLYDGPRNLAKTQTNPPILLGQNQHFDQIQKPRDEPSDCLICPRLLTCNYRKNRTLESATPCPFGKETEGLFHSR